MTAKKRLFSKVAFIRLKTILFFGERVVFYSLTPYFCVYM